MIHRKSEWTTKRRRFGEWGRTFLLSRWSNLYGTVLAESVPPTDGTHPILATTIGLTAYQVLTFLLQIKLTLIIKFSIQMSWKSLSGESWFQNRRQYEKAISNSKKMTKATQEVEGGVGTLPVDGITGPELISNIRYKIFIFICIIKP